MNSNHEYDLSTIKAAIVTMSDRVVEGERPDSAGPVCQQRLIDAGFGEVTRSTVPEQAIALATTVRQLLDEGIRLVIVLGGTGFRRNNDAPEVLRELIDVELPGIAERIRAYGITHSPLAPLSRQVVGVTEKDTDGALLVCSPGSVGGINDTLDVLLPLVKHVYIQLDES